MRPLALISLLLLGWNAGWSQAEDWPQFRGAKSSGLAATDTALPADIGPDKHVVWKADLPPGHSSPIVVGERIFLTAVRDGRLVTIGLDRASGKVLGEAEAPHEKLENIHRIGSYAQASPASDGERVISFFGSSGLFCYDLGGKLLWKLPMGPFNNDFGAGSSPIVSGDAVILCQDHDTDSFLMALDKHTGKTLWKVDRSEFPRNYCTPIVWEVAGKKQIVVAATLRVVGYDFETGKELWTVRGISRTVCMTPVVGDGNVLYVAGWAAGGDADSRIVLETFEELAARVDKNQSGTLEEDELPSGDVKRRYTQVDRDKSGTVTRAEYEFFRGLIDAGRNVVVAIKPGGEGDITTTHVLWETNRFVPFCASPLYYRGLIFTIKDGGILACLGVQAGEAQKQKRLAATGDYYSSPVAGDGKVYLLSEEGKLTVVDAKDQWQVLATADFGEPVFATPALVAGRIYLRTQGHLYCFGN